MRRYLWFAFICSISACDKKSDVSERASISPRPLVTTIVAEQGSLKTAEEASSQSAIPQAKPEQPRSAEDQDMIDSVMEARAHGARLNNCPDDPCPSKDGANAAVADTPIMTVKQEEIPEVDTLQQQRQDMMRQMQLAQMRAMQQRAADQAFETQLRIQCHSSCRMYPNGDMMGCIRDCDRR